MIVKLDDDQLPEFSAKCINFKTFTSSRPQHHWRGTAPCGWTWKCGCWFFKASSILCVAASKSSSQTLLKPAYPETPTQAFLRYQIPSPKVQLKIHLEHESHASKKHSHHSNHHSNHDYNHTTQYNLFQNIPLYFSPNTSWAFCTVCGLWPVLCRSCHHPEGFESGRPPRDGFSSCKLFTRKD